MMCRRNKDLILQEAITISYTNTCRSFPSETIHPSYDSLPDAYVKFLLYGSQKEPLPKNIRIFNKVGDAYGQLVDVAYITDFDKNIEFFLSATIYCNSNGIINDDTYDYDTIGLPFMKNLGQVIYDYELKRKRTISVPTFLLSK